MGNGLTSTKIVAVKRPEVREARVLNLAEDRTCDIQWKLGVTTGCL